MSMATGLKYQELKAHGEEVALVFIAQYPPLPKVKKSKAKGTVVTEAPVGGLKNQKVLGPCKTHFVGIKK